MRGVMGETAHGICVVRELGLVFRQENDCLTLQIVLHPPLFKGFLSGLVQVLLMVSAGSSERKNDKNLKFLVPYHQHNRGKTALVIVQGDKFTAHPP